MTKFANLTIAVACETLIRQIVSDKTSGTEEFIVALNDGGRPNTSYRKLTFDITEKTFSLWFSGIHAWSGDQITEAVLRYNTTDPVYVDYTAENLAHAGI